MAPADGRTRGFHLANDRYEPQPPSVCATIRYQQPFDIMSNVLATRGSMDDLIKTWRAHNAIDLYLLSNMPEGGLEAVPASGGMRVGEMFAHINDLRLYWVHNTT